VTVKVVDASALVALLFDEPARDSIVSRFKARRCMRRA
jgi:hypothetical protein